MFCFFRYSKIIKLEGVFGSHLIFTNPHNGQMLRRQRAATRPGGVDAERDSYDDKADKDSRNRDMNTLWCMGCWMLAAGSVGMLVAVSLGVGAEAWGGSMVAAGMPAEDMPGLCSSLVDELCVFVVLYRWFCPAHPMTRTLWRHFAILGVDMCSKLRLVT